MAYTVGGVALVLALWFGMWLAIGRWWALWWFVAASVVTFALYGWDKARAAQTNAGRVPEATLHTLALVGGSPGALAGQRLFHHKTSKRPFQITFWVIVAVQLAVLAGVGVLV